MRNTTVKIEELSDFGALTEPWNPKNPTYNLRDLFKYCREHQIEPIDLTDKERDMFRTN